MLTRSRHPSYPKKGYNGIYVRWEVEAESYRRAGVWAYRRMFAVLNRTRPRRRPLPRMLWRSVHDRPLTQFLGQFAQTSPGPALEKSGLELH
jgi:hypothetical protein